MDEVPYVAMPMRVVFGAGAVAQLGAEVERLGAKRALLISTPGRASMVREVARGLQIAGIFDQAVMHTPIAQVEAARAMASSLEADCCIAIGGGSTIGFGKAIALSSSLPVLAVPPASFLPGATHPFGNPDGVPKENGPQPQVL